MLIFATLLACRAPGTPIPCKAGLPTGLPTRTGQQRPGPTTSEPELQTNPLSHLFQVARNTAEPSLFCDPGVGCTNTPRNCVQTSHAFRYVSFIPSRVLNFPFFSCYVATEYLIHTGNHALPSRFSKLPCTRFPVSRSSAAQSDLCLRADHCTGTRMHTYQHRISQPIIPSVYHHPNLVTHGMRATPYPRHQY